MARHGWRVRGARRGLDIHVDHHGRELAGVFSDRALFLADLDL